MGSVKVDVESLQPRHGWLPMVFSGLLSHLLSSFHDFTSVVDGDRQKSPYWHQETWCCSKQNAEAEFNESRSQAEVAKVRELLSLASVSGHDQAISNNGSCFRPSTQGQAPPTIDISQGQVTRTLI